MAIVGIIPAAGYATRLQPLPCSKEVYPIRGKPVMDYLVERMRVVNPSDLRVVTRPEKTDVIRHATDIGAVVILAHPPSVAQSFLNGLRGLADDDIALLGFPDSIWDPTDGYRWMVDAVEEGHEVVLGLFQTDEPERSDVVSFLESGHVTDITFRPKRPASNWIWGCAAARVRRLRGFAAVDEPGAHFQALCRADVVYAVPLGKLIDVGTREALRLAEQG